VAQRALSAVVAPSQKRTLGDEIVVSLRNAIAAGQLGAGERLQEDALAEHLGVSRGPVRDALGQLEREGLVVKYINRGTFVARLTLDDLDEVYSMRLAIERVAAQRAAQSIDPQQLAAMQATIEDMARVVERGISEGEAAELDLQFHDVIYHSSGHRRLCNAWANLRPQVLIFLRSRNISDVEAHRHTLAMHQQILDALRDHDEPRVVELLEIHLREAYELVVASYARRLAARREGEHAGGG
jgi:DNA-binding GntR family transcriptional regulator